MATSTADPPPAVDREPSATAATGVPSAGGPAAGTPSTAAPDAGASASPPPSEPQRACARCGAPLAGGQDWCLQCGAGAPGSLGGPPWRSLWFVLAATLALVLGAGAAAYAALNKGGPAHRTVTMTVAQTPPATSSTSAAATPATKSAAPSTPLGTTKPPKIPLTAETPKSTATTTTPAATTPASETKAANTTTTTTGTSSSGGSSAGEEPQPILLDTNAASTYNPYNLPAADFGDPSLTIDGDPSTAWTAQVEASTAPDMAEGVLIDLKSSQKLSALELITSTTGITVQVYGANGQAAPESITAPGWTALSHLQVIGKKHTHIKLLHPKRAFTYVVLWISKAPATSTQEAPGHVDVNELELFPGGS